MKTLNNIFGVLVLVAISGCAKVELIPTAEREVSFAVGKYATETKAASSLNGSSDAITSFKSKGFLHAVGVDETQYFFGQNGETITYNAGTNLWTPSHIYYWPKSASSYVNFVSWYDNNGTPTKVTETALEWEDRTIAATDNILFADEAWHYNNNTTNSTQYDGDNITSGVPTLFHHALCKVQINLKSKYSVNPDNASQTYEVTLHSARIDGIYLSGSMKLKNNELGAGEIGTSAWYSNGSPTYLWTSTGTATSEGAPFRFLESNTNITTTSQAILDLRSFMPQSLTDDAKLVLVFTIATYSNGNLNSSEEEIPATISLNLIKNTSDIAINQWLPNRVYTYNLAIDPLGQNILLNPIVESDWGFSTDLSATVE